jgi:hypothetical protein
MVIPLDPSQERDFIAEQDRDLEAAEQTVFKVRSLTATERSVVEDNAISQGADGEQRLRSGSMLVAALHLGLVTWENFPPGGPDLPFRSKGRGLGRKVSEKTLSAIPPDIRQEIAAEILNGSTLSEDDAKN